MPRVRWCTTHSVLCLLIGACSFWIVTVDADCWYEDDKYEEGTEVATAEPCLNCTCNRGALLCYLRVCPKLPNPPPPGCILLHRYRTCCPELICAEFPGGGNGLEGRSDPDDGFSIPVDTTILGNACVMNGSIYGPGSAMHSSSLCEYCYCLGGKQTCVKPKCLLPIEGCVPIYDPTNCCPIQYNCTSPNLPVSTTSSTTTENPRKSVAKGGCMVDGIHHSEGEKVLGVGHSVCDNCYCMKGLLRCEPLSCAPPLLGCMPVIKPGQCCAASYNCSGTIEIQPEPYYGHFPIVSKDYAKFRKEVNRKSPQSKGGVVTVAPFYVLAESLPPSTTKHRSPGTFGTTRHFTGVSFNPSTTKPFYYNSMSKNKDGDNKITTRDYAENKESPPPVYYATTNYEYQNTNYRRIYSTTSKPAKPTDAPTFRSVNAITTTNYKEERTKSPDYFSFMDESLFSIFESLLDGRIDRKVENQTDAIDSTDVTTENDSTDEMTTAEPTSTIKMENAIEYLTESHETPSDLENVTTTQYIVETTTDLIPNNSYPITVKTVLNSTDCIKDDPLDILNNKFEITTVLPVDANEINKLADERISNIDDFISTTSSEEFHDSTTEEDVTEVDLVSKVDVANATLRDVPSISNIKPDIEAILNITKQKIEDYDYDYNEPTLPPSLPNVRIIPFVAADALDAKKDPVKESIVYPQERVTVSSSFGYTNLFSPPIETEGGFVPKEPPILENYYENAVTVPSITVAPKPTNTDCVDQEGREVVHGQSVPSDSPCVTCTCFYGNIVCQKPTCPIPRPGCRKSSMQDLTLCCPHYICDEEAPTVVLDRLEATSNSKGNLPLADRIATPDPFRDVIRTEPAPNLQSLIGDMMPFLTRKTTTPIQYITEKPPQSVQHNTTKTTESAINKPEDEFTLDKVLDLIFSTNENHNIDTDTNKIQITSTTKASDVPPAVFTTPEPPMRDKLNGTFPSTDSLEQKEGSNAENSNHPNNVDSQGVGLLKLAGCNIYGRMYRVGRIISELSGPCLECKCTEVGVQCKPLKC